MSTGERLKMARTSRGLDQSELGQLLGISQNAISLYERGLRKLSSERLVQVAQVLHVSTDYLLGTDEPTDPVPSPTLNWDTIALKLRQLRELRGHTVEEAAGRINIPPDTWLGWESGQTPIPLDALSAIAKAYGVPLKYLMNGLKKSPAETTLDRPLREILPSLLHLREVPILGKIVAGIPIEAQEDRRGTALVRDDIEGDFALYVEGDSMIGAGVHAGDQVIVKAVAGWEEVPDGSMVVALVNGETTLKYLIREPDPLGAPRWWLRAANPAYPDRLIDPVQDRVQGVVMAIQTVRPPRAPVPPAPPASSSHSPSTDKELQRLIDTLRTLSPEHLATVSAVVFPLIKQLHHAAPLSPSSDDAPF
ncbi:helix-turn-helix domain-containing protein [Sulfobacillus sp. hq2]|uniref:helix-turn-helix domain-containing protein n=1 Tax=Sulfobacillus TaxID=28033 RepID=UPI001304AA4A|nr:helix-turn-helix domain-containing protein [Sulfobacillus sp. hq2]